LTENTRNNGEPWGARLKLVLIGFALIGGFFLIAEHRAHVLPWLPWLFLAACPLMHLFMRHGHGDHDDQHGGRRESDGSNAGSSASSAAPPGPGYTGSASQHHHGESS
jgi:DUF2933 family protein